MADEKINNWTIFYSWQSDLPQENNQKAIRAVLRTVFTDIENEINNIALVLDEATRNTSGSPDIPATIFEKIPISDIFVCDLTTINSSAPIKQRRAPNPNVLIELGFAVATIGWERIIMLFNKAHGNFPDDLPFDIDRRRIIDFKIANKTDNSGKGNLKAELTIAIKTVIEKNPLKPTEKKLLTPQQKKRNIDVANLKWALNAIHIPTMDEFISEIPQVIIDRIFHFWEGFRGVMTSSLFHIYDKQSNETLQKFYKHWGNTLSFGHRYRSSLNPNRYFFGPPNDLPLSPDDQKDWNFLMKERENLYNSFKNLLTHIRTSYIEIDLDETSKNAIQEYINFEKRFLETLKKDEDKEKK